MPPMEKYALITAGGQGSRMGASLPKQFLDLAGKPVLMHSMQAFLNYAPDIRLVVVIPEADFETWKILCEKHRFNLSHQLAIGGPTRFHSVKNGLRLVPDNALVAIHDGVRPLISLDTISRVFHFASKFGNAIPGIMPGDSLRITDGALSQPLPRERVRLIQTPQCFRAGPIKKAYNKNYHEGFTDDATVFEADGERLFLVEGHRENIKITSPSDLAFAEAYLSRGSEAGS
jgi:2-C-methyl-D-erythritol 4-phosphate cytidylyltransferase